MTHWGNYNNILFPPLREPAETKFVIVGAGITGLATAYFLLEAGERDIVILEQNTVGSGSTGHSAGMLVCEIETASWQQVLKKYGEKGAAIYYQSQLDALKLITKIIRTEKIPCDFLHPDLLLLADKQQSKKLFRDFSARKNIGSKARFLTETKASQEFTSNRYPFIESLADNISVNPLLLVQGFARYLRKRGVHIYEQTKVTKITPDTLITNRHPLHYQMLFESTGTYQKDKNLQNFITTIAITQKLSVSELEALGLEDKDMFANDGRRSFHYGKVTADNRLLVGYGDVRTKAKKTPDAFTHPPHLRSIERFLAKTFPHISLKIENSWSSLYALSKNMLPLVKMNPDRIIINGAGTQLGSIAAASYAVSKLLRKKHPLDFLFKK